MAALSAADRTLVWADFMRERNGVRDPLNLSKAELKAVVDALDDYFNTNAAAINSALPLPGRTSLTTAQKALLTVFVLQRRYLSGA